MVKGSKRVALYARVSTDQQTTRNQLRELQEIAERHGWTVVATFQDQGISGAKGREHRPGLSKLMQGVARRDFDLVAAWSVDRLGRSLQDLVGLLGGYTPSALTSTSISRASTRPHRAARRSSKCSACSLNSSERS